MHTVSLFGAGKIGVAITAMLTNSGRYTVRVCDVDEEKAKSVAKQFPNTQGHKINLDDEKATLALLKGSEAVISALPFYVNLQVAQYAKKAKVHYLDLTEDVQNTKAVMDLSKDASTAFLPQCGLAPGFISIAAAHLMNGLSKVETVKLRVGALPLYPSNLLKYNLTWSTEGLINEYIKPCELIDEGIKKIVPPLEGLERFSLDGSEYEAFNTSGGLGTLCDTHLGNVRKLDYKTIRYPGHRDIMAFLLHDLKYREDTDGLRTLLERSIPGTKQDKCIIFVEVTGLDGKQFLQKTYASIVYNQTLAEKHFGAIQITTAAGICAPLDLLLSGSLSKNYGLIKLEEIPLKTFLHNEFGAFYKDEQALNSCV